MQQSESVGPKHEVTVSGLHACSNLLTLFEKGSSNDVDIVQYLVDASMCLNFLYTINPLMHKGRAS